MTDSVQVLSSVEHIMNTYAPMVSADESFVNAKAMMNANGGNSVPVVGPDGAFKGVLLSDSLATHGPSSAGRMATSARMTVAPHELAYSMVSLMLARRIEWVPVLKHGQVRWYDSRASVKSAFGEWHTV
jgi:signal-transduction protein with cAMP-binding, CBS, and nucleotidyltransferase domain